ncbi:MarR family winged helix-turn-helix transcriptional regulator [Sporolactobacillus kofuensis]|uniref:MarR family winged helix-turn-helix transcriptional regulator n=1 Tax=Sporolactobacillus kofuensis TaxID=269672 RepID=A0ABW1WIU3_9BACL|nr:helix-turn-helix domain-containing protein [Sporolactobacillus kofuensis]MCO7177075.1 MarR family transcriptional regulator [Sporolactobacillus kofuensis]
MAINRPTFMNNCIYFTASHLFRELERLASESFAPTSMAPAYTYIMLMINANDGLTMTELADAFDYEQSTLSRMVQKLVSRGWIEKKRRGHQIHLYITTSAVDILPVMENALNQFRTLSDEMMGGRAEKLHASHAMLTATERAQTHLAIEK